MQKIRRVLVVMLAALTMTVVAGTPAMAADDAWQWGDWYTFGSTNPTETWCPQSTPSGDKACFRANGDIWFVYDGSADNETPYIDWQNRLKDIDGVWHLYRSGQCVSSWPSDNWSQCNKDYYESTSYNAKGGYGSQVRFRLCRLGIGCGSSYTAWVDNNAG